MREKREQKEEMGQEYWAKRGQIDGLTGSLSSSPPVCLFTHVRVCARIRVCVCVWTDRDNWIFKDFNNAVHFSQWDFSFAIVMRYKTVN